MSALQKIVKRAKELSRSGKGMSWKAAIKKASAEYRQGHMGAARSSRPKKAARKRKARTIKRKRAIRKLKKIHRAEGHALQAIGALKSQVRARIRESIAVKAGKRELAKRKTEKRKLTKEISKLKKDFRAYC
jgi:hypothetical protein